MKRLLVLIISCVLCVSMIQAAASGESNKYTSGDWDYTILENGTIEILKYHGSDIISVLIPGEFEGINVTSIGRNAFLYNDTISEVVIPEGVKTIGMCSFSFCNSLEKVIIPNSVKSIGEGAFSFCHRLSSVVLPEGLIEIESEAFSECSSLTEIILPQSLERLGDEAFYYSSLTEIRIPKGLKYIGEQVFGQCNKLQRIDVETEHPYLESIDGVLFNKQSRSLVCYPSNHPYDKYEIPEGVESVGDFAFDGASLLQSLTIPESVTSIGEYAFSACVSLYSIVLPDSIDYISSGMFSECYSLNDVVIPSGVTSIEDGAFQYCQGLTCIEIPDSVTSIGDFAFKECYSLTAVTIPEGITEINNALFMNCRALREVVIPDSVTFIGYKSFSSCELLESIVLPLELGVIGEEAFSSCSSLKILLIPESVTIIGKDAFSLCDELMIEVPSGSYAEKYCKMNRINYKLYKIDEAKNKFDVMLPSETADIIGSWTFTGAIINNVIYDLPDYIVPITLTIESDGTLLYKGNTGEKKGTWERTGADLFLSLGSSGAYNCTITDKNILMQYGKIDFVFSDVNVAVPETPKAKRVNDEEEFRGIWRISRVFSQNCRLSPGELYDGDITDSFMISINKGFAEVTISKNTITPIPYNAILSGDCLIISNADYGTSIKLMLDESGELFFILHESGNELYVCLIEEVMSEK